MKNLLKIIILSTIACVQASTNELSFNDAWRLVLKNSDELKAKNEDINMALFDEKVARDLYLPNIKLSAFYTHLSNSVDVKLLDGDLNLDTKVLSTIASGIAKGAAGSTYMEAVKSGKTPTQAGAIAKKTAHEIQGSFLKLSNGFKNSSISLTNDNLFNTSVRGIWPLFTGGKRRGANIIAKAKSDEAKALFKMAKQGQFEDLASIYFGVILAKEVAKTKNEVKNALKKHLKNSQLLFKHGQVAKIEVLSAKVRYDKAAVDANSAMKNFEIAKLALKSLLHIKEPFNIKSHFFVNKSLPSLEEFSSKTLSSHPGLDVLKAKQNQAKGLVKVKEGDYYPKVFLFGNYTLNKDDSLLFKSSPHWNVGVGLDYDIISSKGRSSKLDIANLKKLKVLHLTKDTKRKLELLVEKTYKSVKLSLEEYEGLKSSVELGRENIKLRKKLFAQGMGTSLDVIDAELFLQSVKIQRLLASYKYILNLSKLLALSDQMDDFFRYEGVRFER